MALRFALVGSSGYIAPRHIQAIEAVGGELVATLDPTEQVASYSTFTDENAFFGFIAEEKIDYVSICSPSHLHFRHCKNALEAGCNVICEKPVVLSVSDLESLLHLEQKTKLKISSVFQLRYHPKILEIKETPMPSENKVIIELETFRKPEYFQTWKGDVTKSGGLAVNIGVHYFDLLNYLFGSVKYLLISTNTAKHVAGKLKYDNAEAIFSFSVEEENSMSKKPHKLLQINNEHIDLSVTENLHIDFYNAVIQKEAILLKDTRPLVELYFQFLNDKG